MKTAPKKRKRKGDNTEILTEAVNLLKTAVENDANKEMLAFLKEDIEKSREHELKLFTLPCNQDGLQQPSFYPRAPYYNPYMPPVVPPFPTVVMPGYARMYGGEPTGRPLPATSTAKVTSDLGFIILLCYLPSYCNPNGNSARGYGSSAFKAQRASGKLLVAVFYAMRVDCKIFSSQPKTRRNCTAWYKHGIVVLQRSECFIPVAVLIVNAAFLHSLMHFLNLVRTWATVKGTLFPLPSVLLFNFFNTFS